MYGPAEECMSAKYCVRVHMFDYVCMSFNVVCKMKADISRASVKEV
jgi:hypothetical protein